MHTPASIKGQPIHVLLVGIPIGLWLFSFASDLLYLLATDSSPQWRIVAFYTLVAGIAAAAMAAVPGMIDFLSLPRGRASNTGLAHLTLNLTIIALYMVNGFMRVEKLDGDMGAGPVWISAASLALMALSARLGNRMVHELQSDEHMPHRLQSD